MICRQRTLCSTILRRNNYSLAHLCAPLSSHSLFSTQVPTGRLSPKRARRDKKHSKTFKHITVSLFGRPNVGKSTLFNCLSIEKLKNRKAIVTDVPGTTRDKKTNRARLGEVEFTIVDTGGFEDHSDAQRTKKTSLAQLEGSIAGAHGTLLLHNMLQQMQQSIVESDVALFVIDGQAGVTTEDLFLSKYIRQQHYDTMEKGMRIEDKIRVVVNKVDSESSLNEYVMEDCYRLGYGTPIYMSAQHKAGLGDLYTLLEPFALVADQDMETSEAEARDGEEGEEEEEVKRERVSVAIVGRPNVGKSTLLNSLVGKERVITGPIAGLTRDCISVECSYEDYDVTFIDTAGLRKTSLPSSSSSLAQLSNSKAFKGGDKVMKYGYAEKVTELSEMKSETYEKELNKLLEMQAIQDSFHALEVCDVALVVVDLSNRDVHEESDMRGVLTRQEIGIVKKCFEQGKAVILIGNKADLSGLVPAAKDEATAETESEAEAGYEFDGAKYVEEEIRWQLDSMMPSITKGLSIEILSALYRREEDVAKLLKETIEIYGRSKKRINSSTLNTWLKKVTAQHRPPAFAGLSELSRDRGGGSGRGERKRKRLARLKLKFLSQVGVKPPHFLLFTNRRNINRNTLPESYLRFLTSNIRESFGFQSVPLTIQLRSSEGNKTRL